MTDAPGSTSAQRVTAPTPVGTQQPSSAACGHGISLRIGTSCSAGHTTCSANVPMRAICLMSSPLRFSRCVPSNNTQRGVSLWPSQRIERPIEQYRQRPQCGRNEKITWSPGFTLLTPGATSSTMPAAS